MAHKTLVNGTVYEVGGGKTLIDGVAYSIDKGTTLVDGTAYEVGFAEMVTVTLTATTYMLNASMKANGETYILNTYTGTPEVLTLPVGTHLIFINTNTRVNGDVYINHADGTKTTGSFSKNGGTYGYTVIGNTEVKASNAYKSYGPSAYDYAPVITITEQ